MRHRAGDRYIMSVTPPRHDGLMALTSDSVQDRAASPTWADVDQVRILEIDDAPVSASVVEVLLERALLAVEDVAFIDPADVDASLLDRLAVGVEQLRRKVDAAADQIAGYVDEVAPFHSDGFFSARAWATHRLGLSGPETYRRVQVGRFHRRHILWANAATAGVVGVAQTALMARIVANPTISAETFEHDSFDLLADALDLPYRDFERRARRWETLADPVGASDTAERDRETRFVSVLPRADGGWTLTGSLDGVSGAEFNEILAHFVDVEWRTDWTEARERLGDQATLTDLRRTQSQREADGLLAMARAAASIHSDPSRVTPTLNVLFDADTFGATLAGEPIPTDRYRDIVCRTQSGHELHPTDAANTALWAHLRRVVIDSTSVIIDLGRRQRLFTGSSRDAVMLTSHTCVWVGCDQPVRWCQADHSLGWRAHGATVPRNGQPLCGRHNRLKERGYQIHRDHNGQWHTINPDGNPRLLAVDDGRWLSFGYVIGRRPAK